MPLRKNTQSILQSLFEEHTDSSLEICESRANHVIASVINLSEMIDDLNIKEDEKLDLQKRLLLSIRNKDVEKFMRQMRKIRYKYDWKK